MLKYKPALADLERMARDVSVDHPARKEALDAVLAMTDAASGDKLLLELCDPKHKQVRAHSLLRLGERKVAAALLILLEALNDEDWITRVRADEGLRGLADRWEGVGYDPGKPDPWLWGDYWDRRRSKTRP